MEITFGEFIRDLRINHKKWTVDEFIKNLKTDVSRSYIIRIELHGELPAPKFLSKIAIALGINEEELFKVVRNEKIERFKEKINKDYRNKNNVV